MAISVTEILGTDSLSGSRIVINDNFNILASEINAMEVYFDPSAGTITNLQDVKTEALRVGLSTILLDINASTFDVLTNVRMTGNLRLNGGGLLRDDVDPNTLNDTFSGPSLTIDIGTSTAVPPYTIERVGNSGTSPLTLNLFEGAIGQEIFFMYSEATTGLVDIIGGGGNPLILNGGGATPTVTLDTQGQSVHLICIDNGTGNGDWYIAGGDGYTIS